MIINHYENEKEEDEDEEPEIANIHTSPVIVKNDNFANQEVKQTDYSEFRLPPLDLLKSSPKVKSSRLNKDITDKIRTLEETLESFDVKS